MVQAPGRMNEKRRGAAGSTPLRGGLVNIPIQSPLAFIGFLCLAIGAFMVLAGLDIIKIQQVTVKQGRRTWIVGLVFAVVGLVLLYPELITPGTESTDDGGAASAPAASTESDPTDADDGAAAQSTDSDAEPSAVGADWTAVEFEIPNDGLWTESEDGSYTAVGSANTIAWSKETFEGDLEISLEVSSSSSSPSAANIIVYGNGTFLSKGNLIFTVASDLLAISETSIYEGGGGTYLHVTAASLDLQDQVHTVLISIKDREASMSLDGEEVGTVLLADEIRSEGKIGLLKIPEVSEISFQNIRVRAAE